MTDSWLENTWLWKTFPVTTCSKNVFAGGGVSRGHTWCMYDIYQWLSMLSSWFGKGACHSRLPTAKMPNIHEATRSADCDPRKRGNKWNENCDPHSSLLEALSNCRAGRKKPPLYTERTEIRSGGHKVVVRNGRKDNRSRKICKERNPGIWTGVLLRVWTAPSSWNSIHLYRDSIHSSCRSESDSISKGGDQANPYVMLIRNISC